MKFRKKPVVIEAEQWDGSFKDMERIKYIFPGIDTRALSAHSLDNKVWYWRIGTLEGSYLVCPNDFIICGIKGEFYPCKPDIFEATYELVPPKSEDFEERKFPDPKQEEMEILRGK